MKICLNMIVKDEQDVIKRCLDSVKDLVDSIIISDTGSKDSTIEIMNKWKKENKKMGEIFQHKWIDFSNNRNIILEEAKLWIRKNAQKNENWYILFIDADDYIIIENLKLLKKELQQLQYDKYLINAKCNNILYARTFLIKINQIPWKWKDVIHEYISANHKFVYGKINNCFIQVSRDGNRSKDPMKYFKDILVLESELKKNENNRYLFYLAQSYKSLAEPRFLKMAETLYLKRYNIQGNNEERYICLINAAKCRILRNKQDYKMIEYLNKACCLRINRLEAPYYLIRYYRLNKLHRTGYLLGKTLINTSFPTDILFVDRDIHTWKFLDEVAVCACWVGDKELFKQLSERLLQLDTLPEEQRIRIDKDLKNYY